MGMDLTFVAGEGPGLLRRCLAPASATSNRPSSGSIRSETVRRVRAQCVAPDDFPRLCRLALDRRDLHDCRTRQPRAGRGPPSGLCRPGKDGLDPGHRLAHHGRLSIGPGRGGVDAGALFDSWAGSLSPAQFEHLVIARTAWIVTELKQRHRIRRSSAFPKAPAASSSPMPPRRAWMRSGSTKPSTSWAARELPGGMPVQGNLDPLALIAGGEALRAAVRRILDAFADRPHIFNLGHGIQQTTPIAHVEELTLLVRGWGRWGFFPNFRASSARPICG